MKLLKVLLIIAAVLALIYLYNFNQVSKFRVRDIKIESHKIKNNIKITQITDFHSNHLIDIDKMRMEIEKFNPDFIVLTGDIIDHKDTELDIVTKMLESISKLDKDIYFVEGNHEMRNGLYKDLKNEMERLSIIILENDSKVVMVNGEEINFTGLNFTPGSRAYEEATNYQEATKNLNVDYYNVLLLHSPNNIENLSDSKADLVLSGHAHGGQIRLPIIGSIVAPGQGLFPKHDKGIFKIGNLVLYIDSGLGNSLAPLRAFNPVQFSNITIEPKK
ncbi:metallophosphoesterase [Tissierella sp.]|uniref:metallophosphoesterase n=1 Tax=Tissierella sp. TaxID=41274 RepID=UPI00285F4E96|nr:metallophosphoesterase [Tissierella sp.]MDR7857231.1 metallophosphoesterase [Tissierella sp.]